MTSIVIKANGSSVVATIDGKLTSGMVGIPVTISYDSSWDDLIKTVSFRSGDFVRSRYSVGTSTSVPWEVMRRSGNVLEVGIEGRDADGNIVMPTVWTYVSKIHQGANATIPAAPNPDSGEIPSGGGASIDDSVIATDKTWSSKKISDEISNIPGGGVSEADYRHIRTITNNTDESVPSFEINMDSEGQPFACREFFIFATIPPTTGNQFYVGTGLGKWIFFTGAITYNTETSSCAVEMKHTGGGWWRSNFLCQKNVSSPGTGTYGSNMLFNYRSFVNIGEKVSNLLIYGGNTTFAPGTTFEIYGK